MWRPQSTRRRRSRQHYRTLVKLVHGGEEGGDDGSADGDVLHPDLVSYSSGSLQDLDGREVSLDKLQWILSEISESNGRFLSLVEDEGFLDVLDEMVSHKLVRSSRRPSLLEGLLKLIYVLSIFPFVISYRWTSQRTKRSNREVS